MDASAGSSVSVASRPSDAGRAETDLRRDRLAAILAIDFRAPTRDFWTDEAILNDRLLAAWAGLDDAAWRLPGAAPSDSGGPDWSLLEHVAHLVDWQEIAVAYVGEARHSGRWPTDDDYDGGDFDTFNEGRRERYASLAPADIRRLVQERRAALLEVCRDLPLGTIRSDAAWGWVFNVLHGHAIDHLRVIEPWAALLRVRQAQNDPFGPDPQPLASDLAAARDRFWADAAGVFASFDELVRDLPSTAWLRTTDTDWTIADHVGHLGTWFDVAAGALVEHRASGRWQPLPAEGIDAFNDRSVGGLRGTEPGDLLARFDAGRARLEAEIRRMSDAEWLDPDGFGWAYEDLHGHVRSHLALFGSAAATAAWPER